MATPAQTEAQGPLRTEIGILLQTALLVFIVTVVIGILNGTDVVDFSRKALLTHVHAGTLGWITTSVFAASLWLFAGGPALTAMQKSAARWLTIAAIVAIPLYVLAFYVTFGVMRPILGILAVAAIIGFFLWVVSRAKGQELTTPHWGILAAVGTSISGGVVGVLLGFRIATGAHLIPTTAADAHPGTMVVGFLIPVGMAMSEWGLAWPAPKPAGRLGMLQILLPFLGGAILLVGLLLGIEALLPPAALIELVGVGIFVYRMFPAVRRLNWFADGAARHAAFSGLSILLNIIFINYLVAKYEGDFDRVPAHLLLALDHTMFIGVMTNAIFALMLGATETNRPWRPAEHFIFWGMNIGITGFVVGLLFDVTVMKQVFTPLMGTAILVALATFTYRLRTAPRGSVSAR